MYHIPLAVARTAAAGVRVLSNDPAGRLLRTLDRERSRAFLTAPVLLGLGIGSYFAAPVEPPLWLPPLLLGFALFTLRALWATDWRLPAIAVCLMAVGLCLVVMRTLMVEAPILRAEVGPTRLSGVILSVERRADGTRLTIRPDSFGRLKPADLPARLKISVRGGAETAAPGDRVSMTATATPPSPPAEPGAFDFQRHAFYRAIGGYGYALGKAVIEPGEGARRLARFRDRISRRIHEAVGGNEGGIAAALVTGDRSGVSEAQWRSLRDSGLAHLLAISGLHMGLVTGFLFFGLRAVLAAFPAMALRRPIKKWAALVAIVGGLAYLTLTGGSAPTLRAFVMLAIIMIAVIADRRAISLRTVAIAAILILAITPEALIEPGFQMSFAAVTALVATYERFGASWRSGLGRAGPVMRLLRYLAGVAMTTLVAGAATGPFVIYHFGRFADYGVLANIVAVPTVAFWVMPSATMAALLMPLGLEQPFFWIMGQGIAFVMAVATWVAELPGAVRLAPAMPLWGLVAIAGGGLWLCLMSQAWRCLGLPLIALGLISPYVTERPLVRIDSEARLIAVRDAEGGVMLSSMRREAFTAGQWLARDAVAAASPWPRDGVSADGRLRCDALGCILRRDGWMIALPKSAAATAEDCRRADIVISLEPVRGRCPAARVVIDRFDVWRNGAHALWLTDAGPRVRSVDALRGRRRWNPDPLPRKDQYWRNSAVKRP